MPEEQRRPSTASSVQSLSRVQLFATPWTAARQASLSITNSQSVLKLMSIESVMPPNHLIRCHPLLLLPSIFPSIRVFSNESVLCIRWPKDWSFSISPSNEYSGQTKIKKTKTTKSPQMPSLGRRKASQPEKVGGTPLDRERCSEDLLWAGPVLPSP